MSTVEALSTRARKRYRTLAADECDRLARFRGRGDRRSPPGPGGPDRRRSRRGGALCGQASGASARFAAPAARGEAADPVDTALAEHLQARLETEERLAVTLRATCGLRQRSAAATLNLTVSELRRLEHRAREEAEQLALSYHHDLVCEPPSWPPPTHRPQSPRPSALTWAAAAGARASSGSASG
jgi:hypothetical protein